VGGGIQHVCVCVESIVRMDFCIYARDAKETFTNEVVIGSCSFAALPASQIPDTYTYIENSLSPYPQ